MANYCCSQCNFTAQFESALNMHKQLHHGSLTDSNDSFQVIKKAKDNSFTTPLTPFKSISDGGDKHFKLPMRTSSATKLFGKLRARICKSKTLFVHEEEPDSNSHDLAVPSECTSKAFKSDSRMLPQQMTDLKESYACHLCSFDADRITVLDRHLLNDHKIGLENLLKLVMAKTRNGLALDETSAIFGLRQPYYKPQDEMIEDGEFIIENVTPKIKILKHASTNTDLKWFELPDLKNNCLMISEDLERFIRDPNERSNADDIVNKMQVLNEHMCKFFHSSNNIKKVLKKEFDKGSDKDLPPEEMFDLGLGDQETPREWARSQSDKMEGKKSNFGEKSRSDKSKFSADSFYF